MENQRIESIDETKINIRDKPLKLGIYFQIGLIIFGPYKSLKECERAFKSLEPCIERRGIVFEVKNAKKSKLIHIIGFINAIDTKRQARENAENVKFMKSLLKELGLDKLEPKSCSKKYKDGILNQLDCLEI
jgi:hypothetical protein